LPDFLVATYQNGKNRYNKSPQKNIANDHKQ
jgi:hypothetical protein